MKDKLQAELAQCLAKDIDKSIVDYSTEIEEAIKQNAALRERIGILGECLHLQSENLQELHSVKHLVEHAQEGVEKCFERIEKLEHDYASKRDNRKDLNDALSAIQHDYKAGISAIEAHIKQYHELVLGGCPIDIEKTIRDNMRGKSPHKCPVCEGKGVEFDRLNRGEGFNTRCKSCEGRGIVWG